MYRTIYSDTSSPTPGLTSPSWYGKKSSPMSRKKALEKCQCMRLKYLHHWSWFKKGVGILLVVVSIVILIWNEKRAVDNSRSYHHGLRAIQPVPGPEVVLPHNDGKLIHVTGYLRVLEPLQDSPYGVAISAVKLKRRVQMYQWTEETVSLGEDFNAPVGSLKYRQVWKDKLSDSSTFQVPIGHENPKTLPVQSEIRVNPHVYLGDYRLGAELKDKFNSFVQFTSGERPHPQQEVKMHMGLYLHSADIWNPSVGDVRVQFSFAGPSNTYVSIIAMQVGDELRPFTTETGAKIAFLHEGKQHYADMLHKEHSSTTMECWMYRSAAFVATIFGTCMASRILVFINRRNSVIRNLMWMGPNKFSTVAAIFACLTITGIIWFSHKPLMGSLLVTFSVTLALYYALTRPDAPRSAKISLPRYSKVY
ncbi:transmembrane protein 43 homolog isoform X1 [Folsomia candida]|uniref:Transmembrane protein 43 n=1 Tax=Folsomia candida TaxID=158441 RepID=A0A226EY38_FOLCA|nr:transmembrane protein 43 homolog isoform X1 [Folsomia candida]OXA62503.1 Transmembrane protein 43 [Folsomia candida]